MDKSRPYKQIQTLKSPVACQKKGPYAKVAENIPTCFNTISRTDKYTCIPPNMVMMAKWGQNE